MYIVAIAWLYVALMATITETTVIGAILTFFFYGVAPLSLFLWLFGTRARHRASAKRPLDEVMQDGNRGDASSNQ